jgi:hypothetical protein
MKSTSCAPVSALPPGVRDRVRPVIGPAPRTGGAATSREAWPWLLTAAAPWLVAAPVLAAIATTLVRALTVSHPDLGFGTAVNGDAEALYLGQSIYQDPADGYTGQLYTPLFPFTVSLLHQLSLWPGWPLLLSFAGTIALMGLVARVAYRGGERGTARLVDLAGAAGVGVLAWWFVSATPVNLLFEARSDHVAWALALTGLVVLARGVPAPRALVVSALLLSAAFWTKQTTVVAAVVAVIWVFAGAGLGTLTLRAALAFAGGLAALNLAVLGLLNLATDGWEYYFAFELARRHPRFASFGPSAKELLKIAALALGFTVALAAGVALTGRVFAGRRPRGAAAWRDAAATRWRRSADARLSSLVALLLVVGAPAAVFFRLKVGADVNQYVGVLWALGLLLAVAYRHARARPATAVLAAAMLAVLFVVAQRPTDSVAGLRVARLTLTASYPELPAPLLAYAHDHLVYEQVQSDLNVRPQRSIYPSFYNFIDLLAAGRQPRYLVDALLDRRFDAVHPFAFGKPEESLFWDIYASGGGRYESGYFWKLNQVIRSGYEPARDLPAGLWRRRAGPPLDPWIRSCFGPFDLGGTRFAIRAGGGLWCRRGSTLTLRRTPAASSELHALGRAGSLSGRVGIALASAGSFEIALRGDEGRSWALRGTAGRDGGLRLTLVEDGRASGTAEVPGRRVDTRLSGGTRGVRRSGDSVTVAPPDIGSGELAIVASREGRVSFDLGGLRVR